MGGAAALFKGPVTGQEAQAPCGPSRHSTPRRAAPAIPRQSMFAAQPSWRQPSPFAPRQARFQGLDEGTCVVACAVELAVDEQRWRSLDAARFAASRVGVDPRPHRCRAAVRVETRLVEPELPRIGYEVRICQGPLTLEQQVVHLPELVLSSSGLG